MTTTAHPIFSQIDGLNTNELIEFSRMLANEEDQNDIICRASNYCYQSLIQRQALPRLKKFSRQEKYLAAKY